MRVLVVLVALAWGVSSARAQDKPWAEGVSAANQQQALEIYQRANSAFEQAQFKEALAEYERALALWDHPAIRYNAAVCLINLDRPVEAYQHLLAALRFGEPPLGRELHQQAITYRKMLAKQVAELEVVLDEPGAKVSLDGRHLFDAPNRATKYVATAQEHQIVAEKEGYKTKTETIRLAPGKHTLVLKLEPLRGPGRLERRWHKWTPRVMLAGGGAAAVFGVAMAVIAVNHRDRYDDAFTRVCPDGCHETELASYAQTHFESTGEDYRDDVKLKSTARFEGIIATTALAVGAAVIAAGVTMELMNEPRLVAPAVSADAVGLAVSGRW